MTEKKIDLKKTFRAEVVYTVEDIFGAGKGFASVREEKEWFHMFLSGPEFVGKAKIKVTEVKGAKKA